MMYEVVGYGTDNGQTLAQCAKWRDSRDFMKLLLLFDDKPESRLQRPDRKSARIMV
jgi:hypothetical protein